MGLPINIESLLSGHSIEGNQLKYKEGWNPDAIYRTICAFANDFEDTGGGYIVIGVKEKNGRAVRPVIGINPESIEHIEEEMIQMNNLIQPYYQPRLFIENVDDKTILVIKATAGEKRPYKAPDNITAKHKVYNYYIRYNSSSIIAKNEYEQELMDLANKTPYDDRGNPNISMKDISTVLLRDYLVKVNSSLADENLSENLHGILDQMDLLEHTAEGFLIKNIAVMMFCEEPWRFFKQMQVDIVMFPDGREENPNNLFEAPTIKGTVTHIIRETLTYLRTNIIKERIIKPKDDEHSKRFFNYPYQALEEAVVNALYHRDYTQREPVGITIEPHRISILSFSGPNHTISMESIKEARLLRSRRYRNRRLGEFLKELDLTEGRATGIPTIQDELKKNGSPKATIETDEERTFFLIDIPCHPDFTEKLSVIKDEGKYVSDAQDMSKTRTRYVQDNNIDIEGLMEILSKTRTRRAQDAHKINTNNIIIILQRSITESTSQELLQGIENISINRLKRKYIGWLLDAGLIAMTIPDKPTSKYQKYIITQLGLQIIKRI